MNIKKKNAFPYLFSIVMLFVLCGQVIAAAEPKRPRLHIVRPQRPGMAPLPVAAAVPMQCAASALPEVVAPTAAPCSKVETQQQVAPSCSLALQAKKPRVTVKGCDSVKADVSEVAAQELIYTKHARERMEERNITEGDVECVIMVGQRFLDTECPGTILYVDTNNKTSKQLIVVTKKDDKFPNKIIIITLYNSYAPRASKVIMTIQNIIKNYLADSRAGQDIYKELFAAIVANDIKKVQSFIDAGISLNEQRTCLNLTALHVATAFCHKKIVRLLVNASQINVALQDKLGRIPLHFAALQSSKTIVRTLLGVSDKQDLDCRDIRGNTPLHYAFNGFRFVTYLLIRAGAKLNIKNLAGQTPQDCVQDMKVQESV
jgi:hypothetical protein